MRMLANTMILLAVLATLVACSPTNERAGDSSIGEIIDGLDNRTQTAEDNERDILAETVLAQTFARLRQRKSYGDEILVSENEASLVPIKESGKFRVALLLPFSGETGAVAQDIRRGAELALFTLKRDHVDMVFFDTNKGVDLAMSRALESGADAILGPLFAHNTHKILPMAERIDIPLISFSNDAQAALKARENTSSAYLLGQMPEQEIETALAYVLAEKALPRIAIIAADTPYGERVSGHAEQFLRTKDIYPVALARFDSETLASENSLRQAASRFTEQTLAIATPNTIVFAGDLAFSLRVAPVLAWYGFDSEQVLYLGTSLWDDLSALREPSLRGGIFATAPQDKRALFDELWHEGEADRASRYVLLGFDAMALLITLSAGGGEDLALKLQREEGFSGFSGHFRFLSDGRNLRLLDLRSIGQGASKVIEPAASRFN